MRQMWTPAYNNSSGSFHSSNQSFTETKKTKTKTKRLKFGFSPEFGLTNHCIAHHCSLNNVIADVIADISVFLSLFINWRKMK